MAESVSPLSSECMLNAFYTLTNFLLAHPHSELHLTGMPIHKPPADIRLHDFALRYHLDLTCLTQVFRTVFAVQHLAHHYNTWTHKCGHKDIEQFSHQTLCLDTDVREVGNMITDGQRLLQIEHATQSPYMAFIVALDWRRFEITMDDQIIQLTNGLLCTPAVQAILDVLNPQWIYDSFRRYHDQLLEFRLGGADERFRFMNHSTTRCRGCNMFLRPEFYNQTFCVGCRRGGFYCPTAQWTATDSPRQQFLTSVSEILQRVSSKCGQLDTILTTGNSLADPRPVLSVDRAPYTNDEAWVLNVVSEIDQKLERFCQGEPAACNHCRERKVKCSLKLVPKRKPPRFRTLAPLYEADEVPQGSGPG